MYLGPIREGLKVRVSDANGEREAVVTGTGRDGEDEVVFLGDGTWTRPLNIVGVAGSERRYVAEFEPQKWVGDDAYPAEPKGETEWDCTAFVTSPPEWVGKDYFGKEFRKDIENSGEYLDRDDVLKDDPAAPAWVREWRGPFTITVRLAGRSD